jgi:hypothetical protein
MTRHDPGCPTDADGAGAGEDDGVGAGAGNVGLGAAAVGLGAAAVGLGGGGVRVDPGGGCREAGELWPDWGCPPPVAGDVAGIAATGCTRKLRRRWVPGRREGRLVLPPWNDGWADAAGPCDLGDVGSRRLATTTAVAPATAAPVHAAGRARIAVAARRAKSRNPASSAIPIGRPARHPARREARIASMTAARCRLASRALDT